MNRFDIEEVKAGKPVIIKNKKDWTCKLILEAKLDNEVVYAFLAKDPQKRNDLIYLVDKYGHDVFCSGDEFIIIKEETETRYDYAFASKQESPSGDWAQTIIFEVKNKTKEEFEDDKKHFGSDPIYMKEYEVTVNN